MTALVALNGCGDDGGDDAEPAGSDVVPVGEPIEVQVEDSNWTFVVTGYDASVAARELGDDYSSMEPIPGKRYAVTTIDATNQGDALRGVTAWVNLEYLVGGMTTTGDDECSVFADDDYAWLEALATTYADIESGATAEVAICRLVADEEVNDVRLVIEPKSFGE